MKTVAILLLALLAGCASMTPTEKKVAGFAAGILIIGAIAAHDSSGSSAPVGTVGPPPSCVPQPNGTCR